MDRAADLHAPEPVRAAPARVADFDRPLVAILGLPFDALTRAEAVQRIRAAAFAGRRCFVSTPNLNFAITARTQPMFRGSVLRSDMCLVDGMPLVWIARLLGQHVPERVSGADVFEALQAHDGPPVDVYLFGAPEGAAATARERINQRRGGLRCVGVDPGGFGDVASLSTDAHVERINASGARFVIVSLGAAKGQAWIERNAGRLHAAVLCHLGAVVNFAAGTVARAPRWMQRVGLEWAWRIKEEPALWRRYARDATAAAALLGRRVIPDAIASRVGRSHDRGELRVTTVADASTTTLALQGSGRGDLAALRQALSTSASAGSGVVLDLHGVDEVGATFVALLLVADGWFRERGGIAIVGATPSVAAALRRKLAGELL